MHLTLLKDGSQFSTLDFIEYICHKSLSQNHNNSLIFDRESISHGPTSLKIVVGGVQCFRYLFIVLMMYSSL